MAAMTKERHFLPFGWRAGGFKIPAEAAPVEPGVRIHWLSDKLHHPRRWPCRFQKFGFPLVRYASYQVLTFTSVGLLPTARTSFSWTQCCTLMRIEEVGE
jgi:hypothetical protein